METALPIHSFSKAVMAFSAAVAFLQIEHAQAQTPVAIELVLAVDTSRSVDGFEYDLLMKGIADAFRRPEIIGLIGQLDGVAVSLFQWSSEINEQYMIPWRLLKDRASVLSFADTVEQAERDPKRLFTAIGRSRDLTYAIYLFLIIAPPLMSSYLHVRLFGLTLIAVVTLDVIFLSYAYISFFCLLAGIGTIHLIYIILRNKCRRECPVLFA